MNELVTAFKNLIRDLNFKLGSEQEEYRWSKAEHYELENQINERLRDARVRFGVSSAHLQNTLYPERARLEALIAADEQLVADTEAAIDKSTRERAEAQASYEQLVIDHDMAKDAVQECLALVRGLLNGGSFAEIKKAQTHLKKLQGHLKALSPVAHLAQALAELAQDFADQSATQKVLDLLNQLFGNLMESRADADRVNVSQIEVFNKYLAVCYDTIEQAEARLLANNAELEVVNSDIAHQEEARDIAANDRDVAQQDLDDETARWDAYVTNYEAYIAELMHELDALDQVIGLFAGADISDEMLARIDL